METYIELETQRQDTARDAIALTMTVASRLKLHLEAMDEGHGLEEKLKCWKDLHQPIEKLSMMSPAKKRWVSAFLSSMYEHEVASRIKAYALIS